MGNTSIKKSHSKISNGKLTLLAFITSIFVSLLWMTLALKSYFPTDITWYIALGGTSLLVIICLSLFNKFKR